MPFGLTNCPCTFGNYFQYRSCLLAYDLCKSQCKISIKTSFHDKLAVIFRHVQKVNSMLLVAV